jgi:serine/threonine-protein kinase RsbT
VEPQPEQFIPINSDASLLDVRRAVDQHGRAIGFGLVDHARLMTAASELARNIILYAKGGSVTIEPLSSMDRVGIRMVFKDEGPGIPDLARAMQDGYTTGRGMGLGLPGTKRLVHEFSIDSAVGRGTRVSIVQWKR